jgi:hypothetical protein
MVHVSCVISTGTAVVPEASSLPVSELERTSDEAATRETKNGKK